MSAHHNGPRAINRADWTEREVAILKGMWGTVETQQLICDRLGRSSVAIRAKAASLNLGPFNGWGSTRMKIPVLSKAERHRAHMRKIGCIRHRAAIRQAEAPIIIVPAASPLGPPIRRIEPATAALIECYLERRAT